MVFFGPPFARQREDAYVLWGSHRAWLLFGLGECNFRAWCPAARALQLGTCQGGFRKAVSFGWMTGPTSWGSFRGSRRWGDAGDEATKPQRRLRAWSCDIGAYQAGPCGKPQQYAFCVPRLVTESNCIIATPLCARWWSRNLSQHDLELLVRGPTMSTLSSSPPAARLEICTPGCEETD